MTAERVRRNAVRFHLKGEMTMESFRFSRMVLQKELEFRPEQLDYIFAFPGGKNFEVIFTTFQQFENCLKRFNSKKDTEPLNNFEMSSLIEAEKRVVNVTMFNEFVQSSDIKTWLGQHCVVTHGGRTCDADNIKTGYFKFFVTLRKNRTTGELQHIPSAIRLGAAQGNVFYKGQPKKCRRCEEEGHFARECTKQFCTNCQSIGHWAEVCQSSKHCNLCGSKEHVFRSCPKSYAFKIKATKAQEEMGPPSMSAARKTQEDVDAEEAELAAMDLQMQVEREENPFDFNTGLSLPKSAPDMEGKLPLECVTGEEGMQAVLPTPHGSPLGTAEKGSAPEVLSTPTSEEPNGRSESNKTSTSKQTAERNLLAGDTDSGASATRAKSPPHPAQDEKRQGGGPGGSENVGDGFDTTLQTPEWTEVKRRSPQRQQQEPKVKKGGAHPPTNTQLPTDTF